MGEKAPRGGCISYSKVLVRCLLPFFVHRPGSWPREGSYDSEDDTATNESKDGPLSIPPVDAGRWNRARAMRSERNEVSYRSECCQLLQIHYKLSIDSQTN